MNEHNDSYIHPKVLRALRITGAALVLLAAIVAFVILGMASPDAPAAPAAPPCGIA